MPWKSKAQERWGNSSAGHQALGDAGVKEWNAASKGKKLPTVKSEENRRKAVMAGAPPEGKLKSETHSYDHNRPKRPVVSRYQ